MSLFDYYYYVWISRLIPVLAAAAIVFGVFRMDKSKPGSPIVGFVRHRDRVWFALMLLVAPFFISRFLFSVFLPLFRQYGLVSGIISNLFFGAVFGIAACLFASPGKRRESFNFWIALIVAIALIFFSWALPTVFVFLRSPRENLIPFIFVEGVIVLCYFIWRMVRGNKPDTPPEVPGQGGEEKKHHPARAFLWLLVALAPIPLLLIAARAAANGPGSALGPVLILSAICCLVGGIGCLGSIKNIAVRIILGLFLACFFFGLSVIVTLFEACSHMSHM